MKIKIFPKEIFVVQSGDEPYVVERSEQDLMNSWTDGAVARYRLVEEYELKSTLIPLDGEEWIENEELEDG